MIYSFTLDELAEALIAAKERGVDVKVVIERENARSRGSEYERPAYLTGLYYRSFQGSVRFRWDL